MRALLDTNVILDFLLDRPPFADAATAVWQANEQGRFEGYISAITPINVFYVARKIKGVDVARRMDAIVTRDTSDYAGAILPVLTPQDFLDQLNRQV